MLTGVRIQNFRLCRDVTISDLGSITALVGRNGAGKSNILQAIAMVAQDAVASDGSAFNAFFERLTLQPNEQTSAQLEFEIQGKKYGYQVSTSLSEDAEKLSLAERLLLWNGSQFDPIIDRIGGHAYIASRNEGLAIGTNTPCLSAIGAFLSASDPALVEIMPAKKFLSAIQYYPLDETSDASNEERGYVVADADYAKWVSAMDVNSQSDNLLMRLIYMQQSRPKEYEALVHFIGPNGLGLVDRLVIEKFAGANTSPFFYVIQFVPGRGPEAEPMRVPFEALSLGTRRIIRLLVSMLFDRSSVMLLEQPEDSLHQGMTKKLIGLLRQNAAPSQLIFSTHSSAILNKLAPSEIQIVSLQDGFTEVRRLSPEEIEAAVTFMNEEGPLYDFIAPLEEG